MIQPDYYEVLQVSPNADAEVIQAAYKRLALKYHPDRNPGSHSDHQMRLLNEAYAMLSNAERRRAYDASRNGAPAGHAKWPSTPNYPEPPPGTAEYLQNLHQYINLLLDRGTPVYSVFEQVMSEFGLDRDVATAFVDAVVANRAQHVQSGGVPDSKYPSFGCFYVSTLWFMGVGLGCLLFVIGLGSLVISEIRGTANTKYAPIPFLNESQSKVGHLIIISILVVVAAVVAPIFLYGAFRMLKYRHRLIFMDTAIECPLDPASPGRVSIPYVEIRDIVIGPDRKCIVLQTTTHNVQINKDWFTEEVFKRVITLISQKTGYKLVV